MTIAKLIRGGIIGATALLLVPFAYAKSPIQVEADSVKYFGDKKMSMASGNVYVHGDEYTVRADRVEVYFTKGDDIDKIVSQGNVNFKYRDITGLAREITVDWNNGVATLVGDARVWQGENYLEGERVVLYYKENRVNIEKGNNKRVKIIIAPGSDSKKDK